MSAASDSLKRIELRVHGSVQGVNFRNEAAKRAKQLFVTGMVWNESDGSVMIIAEGTEQHLKDFLRWAKVGPPAARVVKHQVDWTTPLGQFEDFSVRR